MAGMSPTHRTLCALRSEGRVCEVVERWNPYAKRRQDLLGFIDVISVDEQRGIVGIQCFSTDWAAHVRKIREEKAREATAWLQAGGKIELWGWRALKMKRGGERKVFKPRIGVVLLVDGDLVVRELA